MRRLKLKFRLPLFVAGICLGHGGPGAAGCAATKGCIAYIGISYLAKTQAAGLGDAELKNAAGKFVPIDATTISAAAAAQTGKTPADETLSLINGPGASAYPIINYEYAISIGAALAIVERLPRRLASGVGMFLELLAGIPSVVIGLWGAVTFGPFIAHHVAPFIATHMPDVPVLSYFRGNTGNGVGMLVSSLVLAIMIIPIVASTTRDLLLQVPVLPREGAIALGMSDAQCTRRVTLPWVSAGIVGAAVLGLGQALGETMAVAMTCGVALGALPGNIYTTMTTAAATIVTYLDTAFLDGTGFAVKTLAELALVLMVITLLVNVAARMLVRRVSGTALPVGRG